MITGELRWSDQNLAVWRPTGQIEMVSNPWKWIALVLGAALIILAIFTILVVSGVMDFGLSVL